VNTYDDRLVYSPYYPPYDGWAAPIKGHCVDNAIGLDGQLRCAWQLEVQSKVDVLGAPPVMAIQAEHRLNLTRSRETDPENGYENRSLSFSYERCPKFDHRPATTPQSSA